MKIQPRSQSRQSRTPNLFMLSALWFLGVFALNIACTWDAPPQPQQEKSKSVSLDFPEAAVPGIPTATLVEEAGLFPEAAPQVNPISDSPARVKPRTVHLPEASASVAVASTEAKTIQPIEKAKRKTAAPDSEDWEKALAKVIENRPVFRMPENSKTKSTPLPTVSYKEGLVQVVKAVSCAGIEKRRPFDRRSVFTPKDDKVWIWLHLSNTGDPTKVKLLWKKEGETRWRVTLNVGKGKRWRTWARKTMGVGSIGNWSVEVHDLEGNILDTLQFHVQEPRDVSLNSDV